MKENIREFIIHMKLIKQFFKQNLPLDLPTVDTGISQEQTIMKESKMFTLWLVLSFTKFVLCISDRMWLLHDSLRIHGLSTQISVPCFCVVLLANRTEVTIISDNQPFKSLVHICPHLACRVRCLDGFLELSSWWSTLVDLFGLGPIAFFIFVSFSFTFPSLDEWKHRTLTISHFCQWKQISD